MFGDEIREFSEEEKQSISTGDTRWGRWRYIPKEISEDGKDRIGILMRDDWDQNKWKEEDFLYDFHLDRINTEMKVGNWVLHLAGKDWVKKEDIGDLIDMLLDLYNFGIFVLSVDKKQSSRCKALWCYNKTGAEYCLEHQEIKEREE